MPSLPFIGAPAGFVPVVAMSSAGAGGEAVAVDAAHPLPIAARMPAAQSIPLAGSSAASTVAGPFVPETGRPIWLTLTGTWSGSVALQRSTDAGATRQPLTVAGQAWGGFTANANEAVIEESDAAASYYLSITLSSGTVGYRVAQ